MKGIGVVKDLSYSAACFSGVDHHRGKRDTLVLPSGDVHAHCIIARSQEAIPPTRFPRANPPRWPGALEAGEPEHRGLDQTDRSAQEQRVNKAPGRVIGAIRENRRIDRIYRQIRS